MFGDDTTAIGSASVFVGNFRSRGITNVSEIHLSVRDEERRK